MKTRKSSDVTQQDEVSLRSNKKRQSATHQSVFAADAFPSRCVRFVGKKSKLWFCKFDWRSKVWRPWWSGSHDPSTKKGFKLSNYLVDYWFKLLLKKFFPSSDIPQPYESSSVFKCTACIFRCKQSRTYWPCNLI